MKWNTCGSACLSLSITSAGPTMLRHHNAAGPTLSPSAQCCTGTLTLAQVTASWAQAQRAQRPAVHMQSHVEVPKRGPRNRVEPAGLAIVSFDSEADLAKAEAAWRDKIVAGRTALVSRSSFLSAPHEQGHAPVPTAQPFE